MTYSVAFIRKLDAADPGLKDILWSLLEEVERTREESVTKTEFRELHHITFQLSQTTRDLVEGQKRADQRLTRIENALLQLTETQKRTETNLDELTDVQKQTESKVGELAEAQKQTENNVAELVDVQKRTENKVGELADVQKQTENKVAELAEAQKLTEAKVEELAEAQKSTENSVGELIKVQKRTEKELRNLAKEQKETQKQLGGLSSTVGYGLEDKGYPALPALLKRDFGITVLEKLVRRYVKDNNDNDIEVNIFGQADRNGEKVMVVGECKVQLSKNNVRNFLRKKVKPLDGLFDHMILVMITHMTSEPDVEAFAKDQGIRLYYSYEF